MYRRFLAYVHLWFCLVCLSGCLFLPLAGVPGYGSTSAIPSAQEMLAKNFWERGVHGGKLWDRAHFIVSFPGQLLQIGNIIEEESYQREPAARQDAGYPQDHPLIQKMLDSPVTEQKVIGLEILQTQNDGEQHRYLKRVEQVLDEKNPYVRVVAVHLLASLVDHLAWDAPFWPRLLQDSHAAVRLEAIRLLRTKSDKQAAPLLYPVLQDSSPWVRGEAARLLGDFGDVAAEAILQNLTNDAEEYVREEASEALRKIRKEL
jgi:hypothetical protein